ncbi:hypothetical protein TCAL_12933 [Tigriopus californicus]|uniref:BZIP domain-containing protein n=1 Tax=Tigriopus californicus TaxID=6832 RepID=A0A553PLA3_TIGCA|nr:uncharacterized protein LOC131890633 [Tigriopus californicus]TRY78463.1 hypothetical protein TCAL_12933 [Tigriopus californicus]
MSLEKSDAAVRPTGGSPTTGLEPSSPRALKTEAPLYHPPAHSGADMGIDANWTDLTDNDYEFLAPELLTSPTPALTTMTPTPLASPDWDLFEVCPSAPVLPLNYDAVEEVLAQGYVPVIPAAADDVWSSLECVNPLEVEGVQTPDIQPPSPVKPPPGKKLKLIIPPRDPAPTPSLDTIDTAAVAAVLADQAPQFDLLKFVTDATLGPEDPAFMELAADTEPLVSSTSNSHDLATLDLADLADPDYPPTLPNVGKRPLKRSTTGRARGRPPSAASKSRERLSHAPSDHAYDASSVVSAEDAQEMKYRRMRDLNNEASKRCRQNRKRKFEALVDDEEELRTKNRQLRMRCQQLEDVVTQLKKRFIDRVANPMSQTSPPINLDRLVQQALSPT